METYADIWIDHRKALIVTLSGERESFKKIDSNAEPHFRLSGGYRSVHPNRTSVVSEKRQEERLKHQLKRYYKEIIKRVGYADKILIIGPGESKIELEKEMKNVKRLAGRIAGIKPADKMNYRQIAENAKAFFFKTDDMMKKDRSAYEQRQSPKEVADDEDKTIIRQSSHKTA